MSAAANTLPSMTTPDIEVAELEEENDNGGGHGEHDDCEGWRFG